MNTSHSALKHEKMCNLGKSRDELIASKAQVNVFVTFLNSCFYIFNLYIDDFHCVGQVWKLQNSQANDNILLRCIQSQSFEKMDRN